MLFIFAMCYVFRYEVLILQTRQLFLGLLEKYIFHSECEYLVQFHVYTFLKCILYSPLIQFLHISLWNSFQCKHSAQSLCSIHLFEFSKIYITCHLM